jgi:hypothetical protein
MVMMRMIEGKGGKVPENTTKIQLLEGGRGGLSIRTGRKSRIYGKYAGELREGRIMSYPDQFSPSRGK